MKKQVIISISREYGSAGHFIAERLSQELDIPLYDHNFLDKMAEAKGTSLKEFSKYEEKKRRPFLSRTVKGMTNSPEEILAQMQFDFIRKKAKEGHSMVIVGRCADYVLKGNPALITIFISGDMKEKIKRIMNIYSMNHSEATKAIEARDKKRRDYHNYYTDTKWGDSRHYDLCINSSRLGIDKTVDLLKSYIDKRMND